MNQTAYASYFSKPIFITVWLIPISYVLLLREFPQFFSGLSLMTGFWLALFGGVAIALNWRGKWKLSVTSFDIALLTACLAVIISAIFSIDPSRSWRVVWNWGACIIAFYTAVILLRAGGQYRQLIKALFFPITVSVLTGYQEFLVWAYRWYHAFGFELRPISGEIPRVAGITGSANLLAFFVVIGLILSLTYRTAEQQKWPWAMRLWAVWAFPVLLMTRSRSAFIALAVGLIIVFLGTLWSRLKGQLPQKVFAQIISGLLAVGILITIAIFILRPNTTFGERNVSYRLQLWQFAVENWLAHPLTGSGAGTFTTVILLQDDTVPPRFLLKAAHNWWLNILSDMGGVGLITLIMCWGGTLWFLWSHRHYKNWSIPTLGILGALGAFCVHTVFDTPEYWVIFLAAVLLALLVVVLENDIPRAPSWRFGLSLWWIPIWLLLLLFGYRSIGSLRTYEAGLAAASNQDWLTAADLFAQAQATTMFYPESSYYAAMAMSYAILAEEDSQYLPQAITAFEELIALEPGWPTNYANLAALYWRNGQAQLAVSTMETAVELAPQIPFYHLNLGLWYWELNESAAAEAAFIDAYQLPPVWREAPFWQTSLPANAMATLSSNDYLPQMIDLDQRNRYEAAWQALTNAQYDEASRLFSVIIQNDPHNGDAYLGQSIVYSMQGQITLAQNTLEKAQLMGERNLFWQAVILTTLDLTELLSLYDAHSTFSLSSTQSSIYMRQAFTRQSLPYDVVPQLNCFSVTPLLKQDLDIFLSSLSAPQMLAVEEFLAGSGAGLRPCVTVAY